MAVVAPRRDASIPWTSGNSLISLSTFLDAHYGEGAFAHAVGQLPADHAALLNGILMPQRHYPTEVYIATLDAAIRLYDPEHLADQFGEWAANYNLNALFRFLLKFTEPSWAVARGTRVWRTFHSTGEWETTIEEHAFRGTLRDFAVVSSSYCRVVAGWIRGAGRLTGAGIGQVEHPRCRAHGASECVFTAQW